MGIAEREQPVANAAFTNMAAVVVLNDAIAAADRLGLTADSQWSDIARRMVLPRRDEAVVSHDGYRRDEEKGATSDPLMGVFPFNYVLSPAEEAATLQFYLGLADSYVGSPMLSALYGFGRPAPGIARLLYACLSRVTGNSYRGASYRPLSIAPTGSPNSRAPVPSLPISAGF